MSVGDLVRFRNCSQQGEIGIISMLTNPSYVARNNPDMRLYWVSYYGGVQCFTGNQLEVIDEDR